MYAEKMDEDFANDFNAEYPSLSMDDNRKLAELLAKFNFSMDTFLEDKPLGMVDEVKLALNILYGVAIGTACLGNLTVILVYIFGRRWKSDLSIFLVNLAFSDIVLAVFCMPFTMSQVVSHHWQFPDILCPIVLFLQLSSVLASVYTLVAIGIDRFLFVTTPLKARLTKRRGKLVIFFIWIFALGLSSVQLAVVRCSSFQHGDRTYKDCQEAWPNEDVRRMYTVTVALLTYLIPLTLLVFTYIRVGRVLWHRTPPGESLTYMLSSSLSQAEERRIRSKQRVIKMLVVIVSVFATCWFPLHLFFLLVDFFPDLMSTWRLSYEESFTYVFLAIHFLAMSSSYVNPIIYSFMNQNFRSDVRQVWRRCSSGCRRCFRRLARREDSQYEETDDDESLKPLRNSPNYLVHHNSSARNLAHVLVVNQLSTLPVERISGLQLKGGTPASRSKSSPSPSKQNVRGRSCSKASRSSRDNYD